MDELPHFDGEFDMDEFMRSLSPGRLSTFEGARESPKKKRQEEPEAPHAPWPTPEMMMQSMHSAVEWAVHTRNYMLKVTEDLVNLHGMILQQNKRVEDEKAEREAMIRELREEVAKLRRETERSVQQHSESIETLEYNLSELFSK